MNQASTTWALVVGIDAYAGPDIKPLGGAVADAVAAVGWLRRLGVADGHIFLHASPTDRSRPLLDTAALPWKDAEQASIWGSINGLRNVVDGTRLFVFLSGHGFYEPSGGRMFLTQEAGVNGLWTNYGIDLLIDVFLSLPFVQQFLFMDGCQNYPYSTSIRPRMAPALPAGAVAETPRPENGMVACFAASQAERAVEIGGRGAFMRRLFELIDLDRADPSGVRFDWESGNVAIDLLHLRDRLVQTVASDAKSNTPSIRQTPSVTPRGAAEARPLPLCRLAPRDTSHIRLDVQPPDAVVDVRSVKIASTEEEIDVTLPMVAGAPLDVPKTGVLPRGINVMATCRVNPSAPWDLVQKTLFFETSAASYDLVFQLVPRRNGPQTIHVGVSDAAGLRSPSFSDVTLGLVAKALNVAGSLSLGVPFTIGDGITLLPKKTGAEFRVDATSFDRGVLAATEWAGAIRKAVPEGVVSTSVKGSVEPVAVDNLEIVLPAGGARALAGRLESERAVFIGSIARRLERPLWTLRDDGDVHSLARFETNPRIAVPPGPVRVMVELPWGSWSQTVSAPLDGIAKVELPSEIGVAPLSVTMQAVPGTLPRIFTGSPVATRMRHGLFATSETLELSIPACGWIADIEHPTQISWPLYPRRSYAVDLARSQGRVEVLTRSVSPEWHLLVSSGRLDALDVEAARRLASAKWDDPLLGLAAAYVLFAQRAWRLLAVVLNNLSNLLVPIPVDLHLLRCALKLHDSGRIDADRGLEEAALKGEVPLFRWGLDLALDLLPDDSPWCVELTQTQRRLYPLSTWTAWSSTPLLGEE